VAKACGVSTTSASRWFKGNISQPRLEQLTTLLGKIKDYEQEKGKSFGKQI
jgi:hypothetical protein